MGLNVFVTMTEATGSLLFTKQLKNDNPASFLASLFSLAQSGPHTGLDGDNYKRYINTRNSMPA